MIESMGICLIPHGGLLFLMLLAGLLSVGQTLVLGFKLTLRDRATERFASGLEAALLIFFLLCFCLGWALSKNYTAPYAGIGFAWVNVSALFWLTPAALLTGIGAAYNEKMPRYIIDGALPLVLLPCFFNPESALWCAAYVACMLYYTGRTAFSLLKAWSDRADHLSYFAAVEAMNNLPEGILCYNKEGTIEILNDAMRQVLSSLGLSTDLADARTLADDLHKRGEHLKINDPRYRQSLRVDLPNDSARLFVFETIEVKGKPHLLIIAYDITEEEHLNRQLRDTNRKLQIAQDELRESLEDVQSVAENDALLYLHSRVHDIIGQRLSILHRYLEDGAQSEESFAQIRPLLNSILDDLENDEASDSKAELYAISYAFSLISVKVEVEGELPDDPAISAAFVQVIREASTNAVKHAQASRIQVVLAENPQEYTLTISNNGEPFTGELHQGKGLPGMARAIVSVGGQLTLQTQGIFTLQATVPRCDTIPA